MLSLFSIYRIPVFPYLALMIFRFSAFMLITAAMLFTSCVFNKKNAPADDESARESLMKTDRDFSDMSLAKGMKNAFLEYIDSNGVLLRPDALPIAGADAVDYLIATNDTGYAMSWAPKHVEVAASGDLGYTYGTWKIVPKSKDTVLYGTYVSVWKKSDDGKWKFVLDSGNDGIGDPDSE